MHYRGHNLIPRIFTIWINSPIFSPSVMKFDSLPSQVASHLKSEISKGRWHDWLPGERVLADLFQVSRRSLGAAMDQLRKEGVICTEKGRGNRILQIAGNGTHNEPLSVGLLTPTPLGDMRPGTAIWVHALQVLLEENQGRLTPFHGNRFFSKRPANALRRLIASCPQKCWVLAHSTHETQAWFAEQEIPCVLAGTGHPSVDLPDVDFDAHALCFHAANTALSLGHRRIALLLTESPGFVASEVAAESGFREAFAQRKFPGAIPLVAWHQRSRDHLVRILERLFAADVPPTALLATHGMDYLTVTGVLARRGLRIPDQVSVISRNDDAFLDALFPTPTRYRCDPHQQAAKLFRMITSIAARRSPSLRHVRIEPRFIRGESLAKPN